MGDTFARRQGLKPIFFIGFNKCGTESLHKWLCAHGVKSFHGGASASILVEMDIIYNLAFGEPPLKDVPEYEAWLDLGPVQREWREFVRCYPNGKFVLNTRNVDEWLISRLNHLEGRYVQFMNVFHRRNATWQEWAAEWRQEFIDHERAVLENLRGSANFLRFDIKLDRAKLLADFLGIESFAPDLPRENTTKVRFFLLEGSSINEFSRATDPVLQLESRSMAIA